MYKERILDLADIVEKQPHTSEKDESGFNMVSFSHQCGTPSCIAGWAVAMKRQGDRSLVIGIKNHSDEAGSFLGLSHEQSGELFMPQIDIDNVEYDDDEPFGAWRAITPKQAAKTLRILAATGEVDWSHVTKS